MNPLLHPLPMSAAALMAFNDHVLKHAGVLPGWCTGKLSDVLGLFFFPMLLVGLWRLGSSAVSSRAPVVAAVMTGVVFSVINLWGAPADWLSAWMSITPDPTDLLTLPMLVLSVLWMRANPEMPSMAKTTRVLAISAVALASMATSAKPPHPFLQARDYPIWRVQPTSTHKLSDCLSLTSWVAKSGKSGVGVTTKFSHTCDGSQEIRLAAVRVAYQGEEVSSLAESAASVALDGRVQKHVYVPVAFDNQDVWNRGVREGTLSLTVQMDGREKLVSLPMTYRLRGQSRVYPNPEAPPASAAHCRADVEGPCVPTSKEEHRDYMR